MASDRCGYHRELAAIERRASELRAFFAATGTTSKAIAEGERGMATALAGADPEWIRRAEEIISAFPAGHRFLGEDVTMALAQEGYQTRTARAMGPVIARLKRSGVIRMTGQQRPARTSHGAPKNVWERCGARPV